MSRKHSKLEQRFLPWVPDSLCHTWEDTMQKYPAQDNLLLSVTFQDTCACLLWRIRETAIETALPSYEAHFMTASLAYLTGLV